MLDLGFYVFYALLFIAVASMLVFPIVHMLREPSALLRSAIGIGVVVVLFVISYAYGRFRSDSESSSSSELLRRTSKLIGAGLIMFYITLVLSVVGSYLF